MSKYLPSSQVQDLVVQYQKLAAAKDELPDVRNIAQDIEDYIEVSIDGEGVVESVGLADGAVRTLDGVEKAVSSTQEALNDILESVSQSLTAIFKEYIQTITRPAREDQPQDLEEQFEEYIAQDLRSMTIWDWEDALPLIPSASKAELFLTYMTPATAGNLGWLDRIKEELGRSSTTIEGVMFAFNHSTPIDPAWKEYVLPNLKKGWEGKNYLAELAGRCAVNQAVNAPTPHIMGMSHKEWYEHITSLEIQPEFNYYGLASLLRLSDKARSSDPDSAQKTVFSRLRRLMFLDPENSKKRFAVFAPGEKQGDEVKLTAVSGNNKLKKDYETSDFLEMASQAFIGTRYNKQSLGQNMALVLRALDEELERAGLSPQRPYSELFHELRTEIQLGPELSKRLADESPSIPKM